MKVICENREAKHEYFIIDSYEAGISLDGGEVKSIRLGNVNLKDSYASIDHGELFINNMHISPYEKGNIFNADPIRKRKLLITKNCLNKFYSNSFFNTKLHRFFLLFSKRHL